MSDPADRVEALEKTVRSLRTTVAVLLVAVVVVPLALSAFVMRWADQKVRGTGYLVVADDDTIHGMARVTGAGEDRTTSVEVMTFPSQSKDGRFGEVFLTSSQQGAAQVRVRAGKLPGAAATLASSEGEAVLKLAPGGDGDTAYVLRATKDALVLDTVSEGKVVTTKRLLPEEAPAVGADERPAAVP